MPVNAYYEEFSLETYYVCSSYVELSHHAFEHLDICYVSPQIIQLTLSPFKVRSHFNLYHNYFQTGNIILS